MKRNQADIKASRQARRDAVMFLRSKKKYSWRAIAYALGTTPWTVDCLWHSEVRKRGDKFCGHQWASHTVTNGINTLTCTKCGRVEFMNAEHKWVEAKKGTPKYWNGETTT